MRRPFWLVSVLLALVGSGCATTATRVARGLDPVPALPDGEVAHRIFLTGNTGDLETDAVLRALADDARAAGTAAMVVVLGDVTADGLPPDGDPRRAEAERPVRALVDAFRGLEARVVVVPGDSDWRQGAAGVKRLEALLDGAFGTDVLTPGDQAGGPRDIKLADGLRLVALDTAWWLLDPTDRPAGEADAQGETQTVATPGDVARVLDQIVTDRDDDRLVVVAHHPLESRGEHAGYRPNPAAALVSRTVGLSRQDLAAPVYRGMRRVVGRVLRPHDGLVFAAAHDHSLVVLREQTTAFSTRTSLVSGTGGGRVAATGGQGALYAASRPGYQRLVYFADGQLWAETVGVDPATGASSVVFRTQVAGPNPDLAPPDVPAAVASVPDAIGGTVTMAADDDFVTEPFKNNALTRTLLGPGYRDMWRTPVAFPVLDVGTEAGGLTPLKEGGGLQSTVLRLEGADGHEYALRLLEKGGLGHLPPDLDDGLARDVSLQLRAVMAPYGPLVAAPLARAAGVPQPTPRLVYVPDDPRLGRYRGTFRRRLALLEVRPDGDMRGVPGFEGIADVVPTPKLHENLRERPDDRVDQRAYLRARLLDMLMGDWDRHADQWRWAVADDSARGTVYRPIARDRDMAFYGFDGIFQPVVHVFDRRAQPIRERYGSVRGLVQGAFTQDRRFLNELTLADWQEAARSLQARLPDAAIRGSVRALPEPIEALVGERWARDLEARRDGLPRLAERVYRLQAATVDVVGSDAGERFDAERQPDGSLRVTVRGEAGQTLYRRTFLPRETREVRLYGLAGNDAFTLTGDGPPRIGVRIIGGAGADSLDAPAGHVAVFDTPDGLALAARGPGLRDRRSGRIDVNLYDPEEQVLGDRHTYPVVGYEATNGLELGLQRVWLVPGFRLHPSAATHTVSASVATAGAVRAAYAGRMREAVGRLGLDVDASASTPRYARNFYGFGNGAERIESDLARVEMARVEARAGLRGALGQGLRLVAGPAARYDDVSHRDSAAAQLAPLPPSALRPQLHGGAFTRMTLTAVDRPVDPHQGLRLEAHAQVLGGLNATASTYGSVGGEAVAYLPIGALPATLALRAAVDHRIGDAPFFDGAVLGGPRSLRGYRPERFTGQTAAVVSAEVRARLFSVSTYVLPLRVGVLGFADAGRVWAPGSQAVGADPGDLHVGAGGGLWLGVLDRAVLNMTLGASREATLLTLGAGFAY